MAWKLRAFVLIFFGFFLFLASVFTLASFFVAFFFMLFGFDKVRLLFSLSPLFLHLLLLLAGYFVNYEDLVLELLVSLMALEGCVDKLLLLFPFSESRDERSFLLLTVLS